jgi:hypothetical protein
VDKALKIIAIIIGLVSGMSVVLIPFLFDGGVIKNFMVAVISLGLSALICVICILGYWILCDHEDNLGYIRRR